MRWVRWMAVLVIACDAGPDDDAIPHEWRARADELVALACMQAEACDCSRTTGTAPCEATEGDRWRARLVAGHMRALTWDDACASSIAAAIEDAGCRWPAEGPAHPCHGFCQVLHGARELGESCERLDELVSDCAQGLLCDRGRCVEPCARLTGLREGEVCRDVTGAELDRCADVLTCADELGRCVTPPAIGEPCGELRCGSDAFCSWEGGVCRPRAGEGASCEYAECAAGHSCRYDDASGVAVCRRDAGEGESCTDRRCSEGLWCGGSICVGPAPLGASCAQVPCEEGLSCSWPSDTCTSAPAIGAPCEEGICAADAWCDPSAPTIATCRALLADDEPCSGHSQCASRHCPAGACRPRPTLGEDCTGTLACATGLSCDGTVCRESESVGPAICVYDGW